MWVCVWVCMWVGVSNAVTYLKGAAHYYYIIIIDTLTLMDTRHIIYLVACMTTKTSRSVPGCAIIFHCLEDHKILS